MAKLPSGYTSIIKANQDRTTGFLLASKPPCTKRRDKIYKYIKRRLVVIPYQDLQSLHLTASWAIAFFLCPGDDIGPLVAWAKNNVPAQERKRITFYHNLPDKELAKIMAPWSQAGLGPFYEWRRADDDDVTNQFVVDLNTQIIVDAGYAIETQR